MAKPFLFCCPTTGLNVQAMADDVESTSSDVTAYKMIECLACRGFHLVDPKTGELVTDRR